MNLTALLSTWEHSRLQIWIPLTAQLGLLGKSHILLCVYSNFFSMSRDGKAAKDAADAV